MLLSLVAELENILLKMPLLSEKKMAVILEIGIDLNSFELTFFIGVSRAALFVRNR